MPGRIAVGGMILAKRSKAPRPFRIEHRAVAPQLLEECPEWGKWHILSAYTTPKDRDKGMADMLKDATGRWEYRTVDDATATKV
jgi:hypothetical protein